MLLGEEIMSKLRKALRCDTVEDCRRIQLGFLPLRRLGKWSVLFTIAVMLLINEVIGLMITGTVSQYDQTRIAYENTRSEYESNRQNYEKLRTAYNDTTNSIFYRWTVGLFSDPMVVPSAPGSLPPAPAELDKKVISAYYVINWIQLIFFICCCAYCLRWVYADFKANGKSHHFRIFCVVALITNLGLYFTVRSVALNLIG